MCQPVLKAAGKAAGKVGEFAAGRVSSLPIVGAYNFVQDNCNRYLSPNRASMQINNTNNTNNK